MGTWSNKPFGNDNALDWLLDLESHDDGSSFIESTIFPSIDGEKDESDCTIAAAAIVAAASFSSIQGLPKDAKSWVSEKGYNPRKKIIDASIKAIKAIMVESETRDLWEEAGEQEFNRWLIQIGKLLDKLNRACNAELPRRTPKRPGVPRVLYKLIEYYAKYPEEKIKQRLHKKLLAIEDVNWSTAETDDEYPLLLVIEHGLLEETKILIGRGAKIDAKGRLGTPIATACCKGHLAIAKLLIESGASIMDVIYVDKNTGERIPRLNWANKERAVPFEYSSSLFHAAISGGPEMVDYIISLGGDMNQKDLNGETLLHMASKNGNLENVRHLIALGIDVNLITIQRNETALQQAVSKGYLKVAKVLLENGANPNIMESWDHSGELDSRAYITALDVLKDNPNPAMEKLLKSFGALTNEELRVK